jgi:hypothetical protein
MKDTVPAILFIGELVRVTTTLERPVPQEELEFEDGEETFSSEPETVSLVLLGTVLESDEMYLTLGIIDEDGMPRPKVALKHSDIRIIEMYEEEADILEEAFNTPDGLIN